MKKKAWETIEVSNNLSWKKFPKEKNNLHD